MSYLISFLILFFILLILYQIFLGHSTIIEGNQSYIVNVSKNKTNKTNPSVLENEITDLCGNIIDLSGNVTDLSGNVTDLQKQVIQIAQAQSDQVKQLAGGTNNPAPITGTS